MTSTRLGYLFALVSAVVIAIAWLTQAQRDSPGWRLLPLERWTDLLPW